MKLAVNAASKVTCAVFTDAAAESLAFSYENKIECLNFQEASCVESICGVRCAKLRQDVHAIGEGKATRPSENAGDAEI